MGQQECLNILEKKNKWLKTSQISKYLKQRPGLVITSLNALLKQGEILCRLTKERKRGQKEIEWMVK